MSGISSNSPLANARPQHHIHDTSDPLPGAKGAINYDAENFENMVDAVPGETSPSKHITQRHELLEPRGHERPMNVQPTMQGSVSIGGESNLPEGKPGLGDKIMGKAQKVVGKMSHNAELHEKGELREVGGKAAVQGEARAPHD